MSLEDLVTNITGNPWAFGRIPDDAPMHKVEDVTSITWYRQGQYQVQIFVMPPNYIVPEHTHPNVDSYEIMMGGRMLLSKHGRWVEDRDFEKLSINDAPFSRRRGSAIRVRPNDVHGGITGSTGGLFMSVQKWLNGVKPHCVAMDYNGPTMGDHHLESVKVGDASSKGGQDKLTFKDAASKEDTAPWEYLNANT